MKMTKYNHFICHFYWTLSKIFFSSTIFFILQIWQIKNTRLKLESRISYLT